MQLFVAMLVFSQLFNIFKTIKPETEQHELINFQQQQLKVFNYTWPSEISFR